MAVTKRTRFEVFRRDDYKCRYCHAFDVPLTIDHVVPRALGGGDNPENLVTACKPCNDGKSSAAPDAELVADVDRDALRWAAAIKQAAEERAIAREADREILERFERMWDRVTVKAPMPANWEDTVRSYLGSGLTFDDLQEAASIALVVLSPSSRAHFRYFCGICRNRAYGIAERAREILATADADGGGDYNRGTTEVDS